MLRNLPALRLTRLAGLLLSLMWVVPAHAAETLTCETLPGLMHRLVRLHVSQRGITDDLKDRVATLYLGRFDYAGSLLLESEADAVKRQVVRLFRDIQRGDCSAIHALHKDRIRRQEALARFVVESMKTRPEPLDRTIELNLDADKRARPKTDAERTALRRKLLHFQLAGYVASGTKLKPARDKLIHRYELISRRVGELDDEDLLSSFLDTFANALDPHSTYFSADALEDFRIGMGLSLEGIGAVLRQRDGYTIIHEVVRGGAADRQGSLRAKDRILAVAQGVDGEAIDVVDMSLRDVVKKIRGKKGSKVTLTLLREKPKTQSLKVTIVRDKIDLRDQAAKLTWHTREVNGKPLKLARIELPSFYGGRQAGARQAAPDMERLLEEAKAGGAQGLMLDLAHNSGGLLSYAVDISGFFVRQGGVVSIEGPSTPSRVLTDDDPRIQYAGPLVVLVSRASASASEILAGAVKDYRRAVVVGDEQTFGKGTVQNVMNLADGLGALKVTTAMFFRPGGKSTQNRGVHSDILLPSAFFDDSYGEKSQKYALPSRKTTPFASMDVNQAVGGWRPVTDADFEALRKRSKDRVRTTKAFVEVIKNAEKAKRHSGVVRLADILDDAEPEGEDEDDKKKDKDKLSPQAEEALNILGDLVDRTP